MPGFPVLSVLGFVTVWRKDEAPSPARRRERNDVPHVGPDNIDSKEVHALAGVVNMARRHVALVRAAASVIRALHLHSQEVSVVLDRKVVSGHLFPRLGDAQAVLGGTRHEAHFRPLTPALGMLNVDTLILHEKRPVMRKDL